MKTQISKFLSINCLVIISIYLSGCITQNACNRKFPPQVVIHDSICHDSIVKDSLIRIPSPTDAALMKAYIDCSNGKPVIKTIIEYVPGKRTSSDISMDGNILTLDCKVDSGSVVTHYLKVHIRDYRGVLETKSVPVNYITGFQWFEIWGFRIYAILTVLMILFFAVKKLFKFSI